MADDLDLAIVAGNLASSMLFGQNATPNPSHPPAGERCEPPAPEGEAPDLEVKPSRRKASDYQLPERVGFGGYKPAQLVGGVVATAALVWAVWVTHALIVAAPPQHIVKADLSAIVGDYVRAQARSPQPPAQIRAQVEQFMSELDAELQRRGARGEVVLVGEAVLTKSVPDITGDIVNAVYAAGVKRPQVASSAQLQQMALQSQVQALAMTQRPAAAPAQGEALTAGSPSAGYPVSPVEAAAPGAAAAAAETNEGGLGGADGQ